MRQLLLFFCLLISQYAVGQVITNDPEYIELKSGAKVMGVFHEEDADYFYFTPEGETEQKKIPRSAVKDYRWNNELWRHPFHFNESGEVEYQEVIEVEGAGKDELYDRARLWFAEKYKDSEEVLELDDRSAGALIGTGWMDMGGQLWVTTKVEVKDSRYRYTISNLEVDYNTTYFVRKSVAQYIGGNDIPPHKRKVKSKVLLLLQSHIDSLKEAMQAKPQEEGW